MSNFLTRTINIFLLVALIFCNQAQAIESPQGILFVGEKNESSDIYLWRNNQLINLTQTAQKEGNACWWRHKGLILASRQLKAEQYELIALNTKGETVWQKNDKAGSLGWPVPSPWDNRILCVRGHNSGFVETGVIEFPDGEFKPLSFNNLSGGQLAWLAPDKIMLSRVTEQGFVITHRNLSTGVEEIIVSGGNNWQSHVNQASGRMFFVRRAGQKGSIFELFTDETGRWQYANLTNARAYDWQPSTNQAGNTLIYRSLRDGRFNTVLRDLQTGKERMIELPNFANIYFPIILEKEDLELMETSSQAGD